MFECTEVFDSVATLGNRQSIVIKHSASLAEIFISLPGLTKLDVQIKTVPFGIAVLISPSSKSPFVSKKVWKFKVSSVKPAISSEMSDGLLKMRVS